MSNTPLLNLPYLAAGQAQKHVTLNESLRRLDALVHLSALERRNAPPASPVEGMRYLINTAPSGVFSGRAQDLAAFQDGAWQFFEPRNGWRVWIEAESRMCIYNGTSWVNFVPEMQNLPQVGVNATADATNRLSVSAPATLLNHAGGGHQLKLNRATTSDAASLLFQNGFSGRAEIGTIGSDSLSFKVSADGASWTTACEITPAGKVGVGEADAFFPFQVQTTGAGINIVNVGAGVGGALHLYQKDLPAAAAQRVGYLAFGSRNGASDYFNGAVIMGWSQAAWSAGTSHPTYLTFETTPAGSATRSERMRLTASGALGIGTTNPTTPLHVNGAVRVGSFTVAGLPSASSSGAGATVFVSNESGGATLAFSDGTNWRRVADRAVVS